MLEEASKNAGLISNREGVITEFRTKETTGNDFF